MGTFRSFQDAKIRKLRQYARTASFRCWPKYSSVGKTWFSHKRRLPS